MGTQRDKTVEWLASQVMPHEHEARARLRQLGSAPQDIDDIVQDAYLHIALLSDTSHILNGRAYLLTTVRVVLLQRVRRERIVRIDQLLDSEAMAIIDDAPDPERRVHARDELDRVFRLIGELPPRCRQIVEMRRVDGLPLHVIAQRLGISEKVAEHETYRGLKLLLQRVGGAGPRQAKRWIGRGRHRGSLRQGRISS